MTGGSVFLGLAKTAALPMTIMLEVGTSGGKKSLCWARQNSGRLDAPPLIRFCLLGSVAAIATLAPS
jgi:hypothetical protein